jgi:hypothetical protein
MKRHALLLLLVLAMSTTALGSIRVGVKPTPCRPTCDDIVCVDLCGCLPGTYVPDGDPVICRIGNIWFVDIYWNQTSCLNTTRLELVYPDGVCIGQVCPGPHSVFVTVYCRQGMDCAQPCIGGSRVCAIGSTSFRASCDPCWDCCMPCWPCQPCYPWGPCGPCCRMP